MLSYFLKKIGYTLITLFGVITVIFFLFNVFAEPAQMMLGQNATQEQVQVINKKYGFDLPLSKQYVCYLNDLSPLSIHSRTPTDFTFYNNKVYGGIPFFKTKDFSLVFKFPYLRTSFQKSGKPVSQIIKDTFPNTVVLASISITIALVLGVILGIFGALYKDSWLDKLIQLVSIFGMSVPSFFSAIIFAWLFGFVFQSYTGLSMTGSLYELDDFGEGLQLRLDHIILPAIVLGIRPLAVVSQLMRNSLLEVLSLDYIRTAKAKGLSTFAIVYRHALKNALNPVVTAISGWFAGLLAGAVFVEFIFGWNGIGKELVDALNTSDLPVVMGIVVVIAFTFIMINILVDFVYVFLDPRIKLNTSIN